MDNRLKTRASHTVPAPLSTPAWTQAEKLIAAAAILFGLWLALCVASTIYLSHRAPLTELDFAKTSWLSSPTDALYLSGTLSISFMLIGLTITCAGLFATRQPLTVVIGLAIAVVAYYAGDKAHTVRIGILNGNIKIGCYVWQMRECHDMLGLSTQSLPSRYTPAHVDKIGDMEAPWYREKVIRLEWNRWYALPVTAFIAAPLDAMHADHLQALIDAQRNQVQAYIEQNAAGSKH